MTGNDSTTSGVLGFLTALSSEAHGVLGGFLVINASGRPLEFHCTAPIKPNRAQEILFGPTLESFLYGEQIGQTLVREASAKVPLICTDTPAMMGVAPFISQPVVLVSMDPLGISSERFLQIETASNSSEHESMASHPFSESNQPSPDPVGYTLAVLHDHASRADEIRAHVASLPDSLDLLEPFGRVREALGEAQNSAKPKAA